MISCTVRSNYLIVKVRDLFPVVGRDELWMRLNFEISKKGELKNGRAQN